MKTLHDTARISFASDNYAGIHPEVLEAITAANGGHQVAYGGDDYSEELDRVIQRLFGAHASIWPVFNGTGANVVCLQAMSPYWGGVVCADSAHINTDECGAPEKMAGLKLLPVPTTDGKLTPELIRSRATGIGDEHRAQPLVVSITQATELGTVYTPAEVAAIADATHSLGMRLHMDGSRLANAAAYLGCELSSITTDAGVDVLSLGGTKNGLLYGDAVVVLAPHAASGLPFLRKLNGQLASKMRFAAAQLLALWDGDLWLRSARHANTMAQQLAAGMANISGITITQPVESNAVFAAVEPELATRLRQHFAFYDWDTATHQVRWMCAFDTQPADVAAFIAAAAS